MFEKMFGMAFIFGVIAYAAYPGWTETDCPSTGAAGIQGFSQVEERTGCSDSGERKAFDRMEKNWVIQIELGGMNSRESNELYSKHDGSPLVSSRI